MALSRLLYTFVAVCIGSLLFIVYNSELHKKSWQELPQNIGMGEWVSHGGSDTGSTPQIDFRPGIPKPPGSNYTKVLVVPRTSNEGIEWMDEAIPDIPRAVYVADDPTAPLHPPKNKGHEVMIYLTYIIDHYDELPDIVMFMHNHRRAWHNADLFNMDAAQMITRLSPERVRREGFMNMRCQWEPGCPDWMHPGETTEDASKTEEVLIAKAWAELFPLSPIPDLLAQPCCAQFALSRERLQAIPRQTFVFYRDWLLHTPLKDFVSGRVWEYMWQFVFTGETYYCPVEHVCYCDGFGVCFGGKEEYDKWWEKKHERDEVNGQWLKWEEKGKKIEEALEEGRLSDAETMEAPEPGKDKEYLNKIESIQKSMDRMFEAALERGNNPALRAKEAGRPWKEGDGF